MGPGLGHTGGISGYYSQAIYFPDRKTTIVSLVNQAGVNFNEITAAAMSVLLSH